MDLGVAVIGLGAMGSEHAKFFKKDIKGAKLVAVVDQIKSVSENFGTQLGVKSYTTIDDAVRDPTVDVVCIATPTYLHVPQALYAMEYGKHVLVEKPMSTTLMGAKQLIKRAKQKGVKLGVDFMERYSDGVITLKSKIKNGELGDIFLIDGEMKWWRDQSTYYLRDEVARGWRGMWETEGGGALTNQGIHTIDTMINLVGEVEQVAGFAINASHPAVEVEDTGVAALKFKNGLVGTISQTVSTRPERFQFRKVKVYGTKGQAELTETELTQLKTETANEMKSSEEVSETIKQNPNLYVRLLQDFVDSIAQDREFQVNGEEGIKSLEVIKAIYLSSRTNQVIKLPLDPGAVI